MFDNIKEHIEFLEFKNIPQNKDCFLLSDKYTPLIEEQWLKILSKNMDDPEFINYDHPNALMEYFNCCVEKVKDGEISLRVGISKNKCWIDVLKRISIDDFSYCFEVTSTGDGPFIVVSEKWISKLKEEFKNEVKDIPWIK